MAPSPRTLARRARRQFLRPAWFLARAGRASGPEREAVIQAAKAAAAAGAAWLLARWVLHAPQPFLAPYAAVFLVVQVTVYRSVRDAGQQLAVVATGVLLALGVTLLTGAVVLGLVLVVLVGLLVGRLRIFGEHGQWVAVTALILVGQAGPAASSPVEALVRLAEIAVGAAVGVVVNMLVLPPVYQRDASAALAAVTARLADLLRGMASSLREDQEARTDLAHDWRQRARGLDGEARRARDSVAWARESLRLNPLRRRLRTPLPTAVLVPAADAVVEVAAHVHDLCEALVDAAEDAAEEAAEEAAEAQEEAELDPLFVGSFADLLDHLAEALEEIRDDPGALSPRADRHPPGSAALELMTAVHRDAARRLPGASGEVRTGWSVEGALIDAAQRAVVDLTGRRPTRPPPAEGPRSPG
ncbi:aromatic acid exporter family protein [Actinomycetospora lutea]|uniref:aromatic acid exporter family protein n=1 Tax=Actinomycetospora lutea TaxID=663604 RepID=UPI0023672EA2|nr:aromatic acid exporter family protein [Actinomycetospora lutea]MDD7938832.1 aromatic acid exporter family protein [Actinomycetospora lutea]